ncbi:MAG: methylenetetrahydrofolate--tRNA-(uracil(54)-C(5))-methyltransferase (FADH(2)-oxidizing) TrmFO [Candidatus Gastranaerophilales bacterium]|nr:methylenetetrahydrofolate--tRNA-(uracil(54)-C(5))-methyltransferase (FADH(2)-oxidizing) TrmFO [Candidatus Gastranaerophilales bacterium]
MINIIGAGLAGCEAALQIAKQKINVNLYEMRPKIETGAHKTDKLAEFVCSNSLGNKQITNASGLLKAELEFLGSFLIKTANKFQVNAGDALAIDRELFSNEITKLIEQNPYINLIREEKTTINKDEITIVASGPLTSQNLIQSIVELTEEENLAFFDAIAPIVERDSINFDKAFVQNRYDKGEACYINCPMNKDEYLKFYDYLINAPKIELKSFEKDAMFFESCMPIEVMASRGVDTLRYGPLKPVGLVDSRTNVENYAVVQLREDNLAKSLYNLVGFQTNLKWSAQKELIHLIPGLENANIVKFGVMHKNTFINSPKVLNSTLNLEKHENIFFAGQITGTEGYTESIAGGLLAGINAVKKLKDEKLLTLPQTTMLGALTNYISYKEHKKFQPINSNWGIVDSIDLPKGQRKNKKLKNELLAKRSLETLKAMFQAV